MNSLDITDLPNRQTGFLEWHIPFGDDEQLPIEI